MHARAHAHARPRAHARARTQARKRTHARTRARDTLRPTGMRLQSANVESLGLISQHTAHLVQTDYKAFSESKAR